LVDEEIGGLVPTCQVLELVLLQRLLAQHFSLIVQRQTQVADHAKGVFRLGLDEFVLLGV